VEKQGSLFLLNSELYLKVQFMCRNLKRLREAEAEKKAGVDGKTNSDWNRLF
jgi:hypothetical protein